ncbi:DUF664 domain-containing protein [Streptosporangium sp. NPDC001681]|uniref:mycothiol transferase n=1 Tax=Streptosporangium sp. NPDC001681 TaxID=3154395 RepID=UPI00332602D7
MPRFLPRLKAGVSTLEVTDEIAGLTAEQLGEKTVPPSEPSLLGLVRHMVVVERSRFRNVLNGENRRNLWRTPESGEHPESDVDGAGVDEAFRAWDEECAHSRGIVDATGPLDVTAKGARRRDDRCEGVAKAAGGTPSGAPLERAAPLGECGSARVHRRGVGCPPHGG